MSDKRVWISTTRLANMSISIIFAIFLTIYGKKTEKQRKRGEKERKMRK
jgi:hypothetical protein